MADRYWVGAGTWNGSNTANWSATSGGSTGASVPTSADNVFFDASSGACTATVGVCANLTTTGYNNTLTINTLDVYGNIVLSATTTLAFTGSASLYMRTAATTFTGNGFTGPTGTTGTLFPTQSVTISDSCNFRRMAISQSGGTLTFTTGLNYTMLSLTIAGTCAYTSSGSSRITLTDANNVVAPALTVTATGTANMTSGDFTFSSSLGAQITVNAGGTATFGDLRLASTPDPIGDSTQSTIQGNFTCASLTSFGNGLRTIVLSGSPTITTAAINGLNNTLNPDYMRGPGTIVLTSTASNIDTMLFRNVTVTTNTLSGSFVGNMGQNSGISFVTRTLYLVGASSWASQKLWGDKTIYSTSSGGAAGSFSPMPQDTLIIDSNSGLNTSSINNFNPSGYPNTKFAGYVGTLTISRTGCPSFSSGAIVTNSFNSSGYTGSAQFNLNPIISFRPIINSSNLTYSQGTGAIALVETSKFIDGQATTGATVTINTDMSLTNPSGSAKFQNFQCSVTFTGKTFTGNMFYSSNIAESLDISNSTFNITDNGTGGDAVYFSGGTATATNAKFNINYTYGTGLGVCSITFAAGITSIGELNLTGTVGCTYQIIVNPSLTASKISINNELANIKGFGGTISATTWFLSGGRPGAVKNLTNINFTKLGGGVVNTNYLSITNSTASPASTWYAGGGSVNVSGNSGWLFFGNQQTGGLLFF